MRTLSLTIMNIVLCMSLSCTDPYGLGEFPDKQKSTSGDTTSNTGGDTSSTSCSSNPIQDIEWVTIEGNSFMMGSATDNSDETPVHEVTVPTFQIMKTEVTVAMYQACTDAGECSPAGCDQAECNHPAVCLSWFQLNEFAPWVDARLPTEAEWEFAARSGGQSVRYPWGDDAPSCSKAQFGKCSGETVPVCSKPEGSTSQGLCDMAENVWEWV